MKLKFDPNLDYQRCAVDAVVGLFRGQELCSTDFTVPHRPGDIQAGLWGVRSPEQGMGNQLSLELPEVHSNLMEVQRQNGIVPAASLDSLDFSIEMETGTGKTYVYLRTVFELNRQYGFSKFVIVVPSVAIKEGTYKTLQMTRDHFEWLYPSAKGYEYFLYESSKMGRIRNFAVSSNLQIMLVTVGAINKKDVNNIYKDNEITGGSAPIELIQATKPIIIVDEPQSVDGGLQGQGRRALEAMQPLCTLRYSATHASREEMVYRLSAVEALDRGLVKQIQVAGMDVVGDGNSPYIKLLSTHSTTRGVLAKVEFRSGGRKQTMTVEDGDDLKDETGVEAYAGYRIGTIHHTNKQLTIEAPNGPVLLRQGGDMHGVDPDALARIMIRRTIQAHLDREREFAISGRQIKVLTLFFVDSVKHYRDYGEDGLAVPGKYATMFEEEYEALAKAPCYSDLFERKDPSSPIGELHNGYFSQDKQKRWTDPCVTGAGEIANNKENRERAEEAYRLIMRDKERLLSEDTPLRFIFSHSALREGWDNPNVFQICALREMGTDQERRQTVGRGLRLCVEASGERVVDRSINLLTVVAKESYEEFAENLQHEIEQETGVRFGQLNREQVFGMLLKEWGSENLDQARQLGESLWDFLRSSGYVTESGQARGPLRQALQAGELNLPPELAEFGDTIGAELRRAAGGVDVKNADERVRVEVRSEALGSKSFQELWTRIQHKTVYRLQFDDQELVEACTKAVGGMPGITKPRVYIDLARISLDESGVRTTERVREISDPVRERGLLYPDVITLLQQHTRLTRRSIVRILLDSNRLHDFKRNPREFIELCAGAINRAKRSFLVNGIKYRKMGDGSAYSQELFEEQELTGYLKNMIEVQKSVFQHVVYDSLSVERQFAVDLDRLDAVKLFVKLPGWFTVPTPLGQYNPDWAILIEENNQEQIYLVVETKGTRWYEDLRTVEAMKIECGKQHFKALAEGENPAKFVVATKVADLFGGG